MFGLNGKQRRLIGSPSPSSDETVFIPRSKSDNLNSGSDGGVRQEARRQVALVEGSTPHLSAETRDLLRNRLRIAAVLFFVGFFAFLIRWFFYWDEWMPQHRAMFLTHCFVTIILGGFAVKLCRHCSYSLTTLRIAELLIFGCPALFFVMKTVRESTHLASLPVGEARLDNVVIPWFLMILTYAIFIPNTWQRAAAVLGAMGAMPAAILAYLYFGVPAYRELANHESYSGYISGQILITAIAVMVGVVGVHTIGTLRREAFAARQLGQYRLKKRLGSGGMGEVYLAEHQMMKRARHGEIIALEFD